MSDSKSKKQGRQGTIAHALKVNCLPLLKTSWPARLAEGLGPPWVGAGGRTPASGALVRPQLAAQKWARTLLSVLCRFIVSPSLWFLLWSNRAGLWRTWWATEGHPPPQPTWPL